MLAHEPGQGQKLNTLRPDAPVILVAGFEAKAPHFVRCHRQAFAGSISLPRHQRVTVGTGTRIGESRQHCCSGLRGQQRRQAIERRDAAPDTVVLLGIIFERHDHAAPALGGQHGVHGFVHIFPGAVGIEPHGKHVFNGCPGVAGRGEHRAAQHQQRSPSIFYE